MIRKKKKSKSKSLLQIVADKVEGIHSRVENIHTRVVGLEGLHDKVEDIQTRVVGLERLHTQVEGMHLSVMDLHTRMDKNDKRWDENDKFVTFVKDEFHGVKTLIQVLDRKFVDAMLPTQMTAEHNEDIKDHEVRIEKLEQNMTAVNFAIKTANGNN